VDQPYIVRPQRRNGRPCLEVYLVRIAVPSMHLLPNGSFCPNDYLAVAASSVRESAFADVSVELWTFYAYFKPPVIKNPRL
jgi:hypothetical protein